MKWPFVALFVLAVAACELQQPAPQIDSSLANKENVDRFSVVRVSKFRDDLAYNNWRGIYIITDKSTGVEYVGVSGIGISELGSHKSGKSTVTDER